MKIHHLIVLLFLSIDIYSQDLSLYESQVFISENDTLKYRILKPFNYDPAKQYPVHLILHGSGERGDDNVAQLTYGAKLFLKKENRENYNSWVIFPQCSINDRWPSLDSDSWDKNFDNEIKKPNKSLALVILLMDKFIETKQVDKERIYLSGLSMGGMGTFELLYRRPDMFAAATPICGNGSIDFVDRYANKVHIWVFHGSDDKIVSPKHSLKMVNAIIHSGGSPKMTLYENTAHGSWINAFDEKDFLKWFHSKKNKKNE